MAESTLTPTVATLRSAVSDFLGTGLNPTGDDLVRANAIVEAGIRQFLFPPMMEGDDAPHRWSFLTKTATVYATESGADLPDDFARMEGNPSLEGTTLEPVSEDRMRELIASGSGTGLPRFYCVRAKAFNPTTGQRWEILTYPNGGTLTYTYQVAIDSPVDESGSKYVPGGLEHSETLIASCLAIAEARYNDEPHGYWNQRYWKELLPQSISRDRANVVAAQAAKARGFRVATVGTFGDLVARVGEFMGWSREPLGENRARCMDYVREGYRMFLYPASVPGLRPYHSWSFMTPTATLSLVAGDYDYDLPSDFGSMLGDFTYPASTGYQAITQLPEQRIRELRATSASTSAYPRWYAIRPLSGQRAYEVIFYPTPSAAAELTYRYTRIVSHAAVENLAYQPIGGEHYFDVILACCLAVAERYRDGRQGIWWATAKEELQRAIDVDVENAPRTVGRYGDRSRRLLPPQPVGMLSYNGTVIGAIHI